MLKNESITKYLTKQHKVNTEELIDIIRSNIHQENIRKNIIVKYSNHSNYLEHQAIFNNRYNLYTNKYIVDSLTRYTMAYGAEFLLNGLRVFEEEDFSLFLYFLYIRELYSNKECSYNSASSLFDLLWRVMKEIELYIDNKYGIDYQGNTEKHFGIPYNIESGDCLFLCDVKKIDFKTILELSCELASVFWKSFFSEYGLHVFNLSNAELFVYSHNYPYYRKEFPGYIMVNGEPAIFNEKSNFLLEYIPVSLVIARGKYSEEDIKKGKVVYLDNNNRNFRENNIVLFSTEYDYIRFKKANVPYTVNDKGIYETTTEMTREQFKMLYFEYSNEKLSNILGMSVRTLREKIKKYNLPNKIELQNISKEEFDTL